MSYAVTVTAANMKTAEATPATQKGTTSTATAATALSVINPTAAPTATSQVQATRVHIPAPSAAHLAAQAEAEKLAASMKAASEANAIDYKRGFGYKLSTDKTALSVWMMRGDIAPFIEHIKATDSCSRDSIKTVFLICHHNHEKVISLEECFTKLLTIFPNMTIKSPYWTSDMHVTYGFCPNRLAADGYMPTFEFKPK